MERQHPSKHQGSVGVNILRNFLRVLAASLIVVGLLTPAPGFGQTGESSKFQG